MQILTEGRDPFYSDEHAHAHVWNHMTGASGHLKGSIAHDKTAMTKELAKAKTNTKHPLHFSNADHAGFSGGKKTAAHQSSYHSELSTAVDTVHALATHKDFQAAIKGGHKAEVMGGARGQVSDTWKKHGATQGATSKSDIAIFNPKSKKKEGLRLSMKKGAGSQLMSAGPEENKAVHDHAATEMLNTHKDYAKKSASEKASIHGSIMKKMDTVTKHMNAMRTSPRSEWEGHKQKAQAALDSVHDAHPALNHFVRKEATTGQGKFGGSEHAATYLVKSASGKNPAKVEHVDKVNYNGPRPRASLPKGVNKKTGVARSGNIKLDERPDSGSHKIAESEEKTFSDIRRMVSEDAPANSMGAAGISGLGNSTGGIAGYDKGLLAGLIRRKKPVDIRARIKK